MEARFMKSLQEIFPRASKDTINANPQLAIANHDKSDSTGILSTGKAKRRGVMNAVEAEFALILEARKRRGEILRYEYEGITLRWADMRYTPDFVVFPTTPASIFDGDIDALVVSSRARKIHIKLIEVKGLHIWDRDIVRFKGARAYWPEFQFEMHQKTTQGWKQLQ